VQVKNLAVIGATISIGFPMCAVAQAEAPENTVRIGYALVGFNIKSGDLTGLPGTTPPGLSIGVKDLDVLAVSYERRLSSNWAIQLQAGIPPKLTAVGAGTGQSVGTVATARIWFPTLMARYTFTNVAGVQPYVAVGVTYTFFTDEKSSSAYTTAFQGTSSSIRLSDSWGPYARVGFEYPIDKAWVINAEYSSFRIKTTATVVTQTPGIGAIVRTVGIKDSPHIFGVTLGRKF